MADIEVRRAHGLGIEGARAAADRMMESLAQRFGLRGAWDGNVLRFERSGVSGQLAVDEHNLHLAVTLGFLYRAMRSSIEGEVKSELEKLFGARPSGRA